MASADVKEAAICKALERWAALMIPYQEASRQRMTQRILALIPVSMRADVLVLVGLPLRHLTTYPESILMSRVDLRPRRLVKRISVTGSGGHESKCALLSLLWQSPRRGYELARLATRDVAGNDAAICRRCGVSI